MDHERFRDWFSRLDELTAAQRKEVAAVLSDPPEGAASPAAIELGVDDERRCPHCGAGGAVKRGQARGKVNPGHDRTLPRPPRPFRPGPHGCGSTPGRRRP